ncbi:MAG TPA: Ig-like domain-containing protein [Puia sp.]|nr:Ig-like domain-containing protein [Puia sp.]
MKKIIVLVLLISGYSISQVRGQATASFNFSLASRPVTGWVNVTGDPSTAVRAATDAATGIGISSVATANWSGYLGACAHDSNGVTNGTFFPAAVMYNNWFQYGTSLGNYNAAIPQFIISGLNVDSVYTIKMSGSSTSGFTSNPTRYTVSGVTVYGPIDINAHSNITAGATFNNIAPDETGKIKIYVNTTSASQVADICGIQIIRQRTVAPVPVVTITSPENNDILLEANNVTVNATATETGGSIRKVEFYTNGTKVGDDSVAPYTYSWVNPNEGTYALTARAIDSAGSTGTSTINVSIEPLSSFWSMTGNIKANADSNFLGTVDTNRLAIRTNNVERVSVLGDGTVGIGTKNTQGYKLAVNGNAIFTKVRIKAYAAWPDYVFKKEYKLPGLDSLERYIQLHQHLPGITPAATVKKEGMDIADDQAILLKKIEELTLYLIGQNKKLERQNKRLKDQNIKLEKLQREVQQLKKHTKI